MTRLHSGEVDLIQIARSIVGLLPGRAAVDLLERPGKNAVLRPEVLPVLEDTLRMGLLRSLVRGGGARRTRQLDADGEVSGKTRVWQRHPPPQLVVTAATAHLLEYLASTGLRAPEPPLRRVPRLSVADELFFYLAAERCVEAGFDAALSVYPFRASALTTLAFPLEVGLTDLPAFDLLVTGPGAVVLESLAQVLAQRVVLTERARRAIGSEAGVLAAGGAIARGPIAFVRHAIANGRPDLGFFVLDGLRALLDGPRGADPASWTSRAASFVPLSARQQLTRSATVWFDAVALYADVAKQARAVGFVDDGFDRAQFLLAVLEPWGTSRAAQVQSLTRALTTLEALSHSSEHAVGEP